MIVVDTTALIDVERGRKDIERVLREVAGGEIVAISAMTVRELHVSIGYTREKIGGGAASKKRDNIEKLCDDFEIIDLSREILARSGEKEGELLARGVKVDAEDIIIGTSAELAGASSLVTRNPARFAWCAVKVIPYSIHHRG